MTTRKWVIRQLLIMSIVGLFVFGCSHSTPISAFPSTPSAEQVDKNPFPGIPCAAPCWHGLQINKSSKEDVLSTLDRLPFIDHNSYKEYTTLWVNNIAAEEIR